MKAVRLNEPGGKLTLQEVPVPGPGPGEVLVRMAASPINPSDLGQMLGYSYSGERQFPYTPGIEGSGTVVAAGEGMLGRILNGRRVACSPKLTGDGTWAEYMVTSPKLCTPLKGDVSFEEGAMMLVNPLSAMAIMDIVKAGGHKAIVNTAAASALSGMIIRLGARYGVPIIHTVRREEQAAIVKERGGKYVLNSSEPDFGKRLGELAQELKATLILDAVAGQMTQTLAEAAPYGSTILLYSRLSKRDCVVNPRTAFVKHLKLHGWFLSNWIREMNLLQVLLLTRKVQGLLSNDLQTEVRARLPLSAAQEGLEAYLEKMTGGKVLFVIDPSKVG
jgi:NADPH:quinone reductase-like Zn-dependent oxidoreductase